MAETFRNVYRKGDGSKVIGAEAASREAAQIYAKRVNAGQSFFGLGVRCIYRLRVIPKIER